MSTWTPLRNGLFRAIWIAALVSNVGAWMQTVGAQWLLVQGPHAAILVALVQTADMVPDLMFGLVGGVLADTFDRRRLLIAVQIGLAIIGAALTVLTFAHQMPPALLLIFTFLLGCGSVPTNPALQAIVPDLVPRSQLVAASALSSISVNLARAAGPALAGLVIARAGAGAVFAINTATFLVFAVVIASWRPATTAAHRRPERFVSALRSGGRYVRYSPVVLRILLRATLFLVPASALWALLPLIASQRLGLGAGGYGLMLAALGVGAIIGAFVLPRITATWSSNALAAAASIVYAATMVVAVLIHNATVTLVALLPAGVAWMAILSNINASLQLFLPAWVRARGLSVYQMVFFGSQAFGAVLWGAVADPIGLVPTFLIAAGTLAAGAATIRIWPLINTTNMDRGSSVHWAEPQLVIEPDPEDGPVVVSTTYTIALEREQPFIDAMARVRLSRLRTGATQWGLFRDGENAHVFVEFFVVPSWDEHLRQHTDRLTGTDRDFEEAANSLSDPSPATSHLIAANVGV